MRIESLTAEQEARLPAIADEWTKIGLCTDSADRPAAEMAIRDMYRLANLADPKIFWCGSPLSLALTRASVGNSVRANVRNSVWANVGDSVRNSVGANVGDSVRDSVGASVWESVWDSVADSVENSIKNSVGADVGNSVWANVGDSVWDEEIDRLFDYRSVWNSIGANVGNSVVYGSHEAGWLSFYRAMHEFGLVKETAPLSGLWALARSAGWAMPYEGMCFVSERHNILSLDNAGRLHSLSGPAVGYPDGWLIYAVHGVVVPERVIMLPETITAAEITAEPNVEIRRVMIERLGYEKYATDTNLKLIDSCPANHPLKGLRTARLLRDSSDLYLLDMLNGTPEPDGTTKRYLLAIDPTCYNGRAGRECLAAMASTWRRESDMSLIFDRPEDYSPMAES
jgi:hypothetical protein